MKYSTTKKLENLKKLIGNTPLIKINYKIEDKTYSTFAKLEWYNLSGSIKDRVALEILYDGYKNGKINEDTEIIETTSGNMGIALSAICSYLGNPISIFMPDYMSIERINLLKSFGAKINLVSKQDGGFRECLKLADKYHKENPNSFLTLQFENKANSRAHFDSTATEIHNKLQNNKIFSFVSGVGTGGTLMGVGNFLKTKDNNTKIVAMEPLSSPILKTGEKCGEHEIAGISDEFIPPIYDNSIIDDIVDISNEDAIYMSQQLSSKLGLGTGISSGANFVATAIVNHKYNNINSQLGSTITVFADDNKKYLSTNLSKEIDKTKLKFADKIKLIDFEVL